MSSPARDASELRRACAHRLTLGRLLIRSLPSLNSLCVVRKDSRLLLSLAVPRGVEVEHIIFGPPTPSRPGSPPNPNIGIGFQGSTEVLQLRE
jgi:hypothetical protein